MSLTEKPTAEEVVTHITPYSCDLGFTFQVYCRYCYDSGRISAKRRDAGNQKVRLKAAAKFAAAGWRLQNGVTVCPICTRKQICADAQPLE